MYALARVLRNRSYASTLRERLGFLPRDLCQPAAGAVWIHAASVGEVIAAGALIGLLRESLQVPIVVSTTTLAGFATAQARYGGSGIGCFYAPVDYAAVIRRVLRTLQPALLIVLETEIWPNLFREARRAGCGVLIVNGRISDKAAPAYARWKWFFGSVLVWPNAIIVQSDRMRERFLAAGAPADALQVSGNLKFDFTPRHLETDSAIARWSAQGSGPLLIAASTTEDASANEDAIILGALQELKGWRLILAPRKPERFESVARLLTDASLPFWRRASGAADPAAPVLLLDTIGELSGLFELADVVFMGGTFTETGGHNFLEPAFAAKPVIVGPRLENFREIAEEFRAHGAFIEISRPAELPQAVRQALADSQIGSRAQVRAKANRGAAAFAVTRALEIYDQSLFRRPAPLLARLTLGPLAELWKAGSRLKTSHDLKGRRSLSTPVISVGNITTGGTGKTPFVLYLARRFHERGLSPAVLTRGYGRSSHQPEIVLAPGATAAALHTGDEAQILLRSGLAAVGIGADRFRTGRRTEVELHPDVIILDDGFSHVRLARDVDVVLIDSLDPFGRFAAVPLGRLREPLQALSRADIFVLSRCEAGRPTAGIESHLRRLNPRAPIFRSSLVAREWLSFSFGAPSEVPGRVVAFCGLGNPAAFWRTLEAQGIWPLDRLTFADHYRYGPHDLRRIARHALALGARALLTTEKDTLNFCPGCEALFEGLPVLWLRIDVQIEKEEEFLGMLNPDDIRPRPASNHPPARAPL